jgi:hypothetical protein
MSKGRVAFLGCPALSIPAMEMKQREATRQARGQKTRRNEIDNIPSSLPRTVFKSIRASGDSPDPFSRLATRTLPSRRMLEAVRWK